MTTKDETADGAPKLPAGTPGAENTDERRDTGTPSPRVPGTPQGLTERDVARETRARRGSSGIRGVPPRGGI